MLNEYEVNSRELVLGVVGSLAIMIQNLGVEAFGTRIVSFLKIKLFSFFISNLYNINNLDSSYFKYFF